MGDSHWNRKRDLSSLGRSIGNLLLVLLVAALIIFVVDRVMLRSIEFRSGARTGQVKQNIHSIQLAIERYATDNNGAYPYFLYGGELNFNIGSVNGVNQQYQFTGYPGGRIIQPFDNAWLPQLTDNYGSASWQDLVDGQGEFTFGDVLQSGGYMPQYPRNPFQAVAGRDYGLAALQGSVKDHACFGGRDGTLSWNLAWFGEAPQLMFQGRQDPRQIRLDFQGSFAYLPNWADTATNSGHLQYQIQQGQTGTTVPVGIVPPLASQDRVNVASLDVAGYDLLGYGDDRKGGDDLDDSILDAQGKHVWRTGYLTGFRNDRNPWVTSGLWGGTPVADFDPRPFSDGIDDFVVIMVGSGMDKLQSGVGIHPRVAKPSAEEAGNGTDTDD